MISPWCGDSIPAIVIRTRPRSDPLKWPAQLASCGWADQAASQGGIDLAVARLVVLLLGQAAVTQIPRTCPR